MAKFNVVQKRRREQVAQRKREIRGDPLTGKLNNKPQPLSVSGKRQRKLLKKWRRVCDLPSQLQTLSSALQIFEYSIQRVSY